MALEDRTYAREGDSGYGRGGYSFGHPGFSKWSVNTWLIILCIIIFVLQMMIRQVTMWGYFSTDRAIYHLELWRFITFQFLHGGFMHILLNMVALFFFGPIVERYLGSRRYLAFYLLCGMAGAAMYLLLNVSGHAYFAATGHTFPVLLFDDPRVPLIGASAGIFGVLMACAYIAPDQMVTLLLFFVIPVNMRMKTMAYGYLAIVILILLAANTNPGSNAGGNAAHLGGAILGALLIRFPRSLAWANFIPVGSLRGGGQHAFRRFQGGANPVNFPPYFRDERQKPGYFERRRRNKRQTNADDVDRILAKVGTQGLDSLSEQEKRTLRDETERQRDE